MKIKGYEKFLEEITIKGNPAIPGEDDDELKKKSPYLTQIEREEKAELGITGAQSSGSIGGQIGPLLKVSNSYIIEVDDQGRVIADHRKELEDLAVLVMEENYGWILDKYEIELDIKFIEARQINSFLDDQERHEEEEDSEEAEAQFAELIEITDEDIRNEVHKRKIANLIIQGEAKNTKHILHSQVVKDGLNRIYGRDKATKIFDVWDKISKLADKLDWIMPTEVRSKMMMTNPDGFAGACGYAWKEKEEQSEPEEETEDYFTGGQEEEEYTDEWTGGDEEEMYGDEDIFGGMEEPEVKLRYTPILRARGVDFPMLLHESVKGLFELLSLGGIPDDLKTAEIVVSQTGRSDEPEDWKYGPRIAKDFRKFIQANRKSDNYPNIREDLFKLMFDKNTMPAEELLRAFRGILAFSMRKDHPEYEKLAKDIPFARKTIDKFINQLLKKFEDEKEYQKELEEYEKSMREYEKEMEEYNRKMKEWEDYQRSKGNQTQAQPQSQQELDYSTMGKSDLQKLLNKALENGDFETVKKIRPYL